MTNDVTNKVHQKGHGWIFILLTMCFTLCGAAACLGLAPAPKNWTEMVTAGNEALKSGDATGNATAEKMFTDAAAECEKKYGKYDNRRATCLTYLAELYRDEQEYRKAAIEYKELITVKEQSDPNGQELAGIREEYAQIQAKMKEYGLDTDPYAPRPEKKKKKKDKDKDKDKDSKDKDSKDKDSKDKDSKDKDSKDKDSKDKDSKDKDSKDKAADESSSSKSHKAH